MMDHYVGLDVSVRETSVCVVDETGKLLKEAKVPTEPDAIASLLVKGGYACKRVGLEARAVQRSGILMIESRWLRPARAAR